MAELVGRTGFDFVRIDLADAEANRQPLPRRRFTHVIHLAAQPGVRHSLRIRTLRAQQPGRLRPRARRLPARAACAHLVYASSSSVYGASHTLPFSEDQRVDRPVSLYAATKCANELMAHSYAHLFALPVTGLRFFTVYGPVGPARPGGDAVHAGDPRRRADQGLQRRPDAARLHVHRRHRGGRGARARGCRPPQATADAARGDLQHRQPRGRWSSPTSSPRWSGCSAGARCASCSRCSRATCRPPTRRSTGCARSRASRPSTPLAEGLARFVAWYREYYGA